MLIDIQQNKLILVLKHSVIHTILVYIYIFDTINKPDNTTQRNRLTICVQNKRREGEQQDKNNVHDVIIL